MMKSIKILIASVLLTGCASDASKLYYDAAKQISKDYTMTQTACWATVAELGKSGDNSVKIAAISLADKCKNAGVKLEAPQKNWLGF